MSQSPPEPAVVSMRNEYDTKRHTSTELAIHKFPNTAHLLTLPDVEMPQQHVLDVRDAAGRNHLAVITVVAQGEISPTARAKEIRAQLCSVEGAGDTLPFGR